MVGSVTVSARTIVVALVLALVALGAYLVGAGSRDTASAADAPGRSLARTLAMSGKGEVTAVPDQMSFRLGVARTGDDVATALDASSATLRRVLAALEKQGVQRKDTESTGLSVEPVYRYVDDQPPQIIGFRVRQSLGVTVTDLRQGGTAVAEAIRAGRNAVRVSGIRLEVGDPEKLLAEARDAAVAEARNKAEQYAEATGQRLGEVLTLREGRRPAAVRPLPEALVGRAVASDIRGGAAAIPLRAGRRDVAVTVSIVWQLG